VPLDWADVVKRYRDGAELPSMPVTCSVRAHLEKAVDLLEAGRMTRNYGDVIDHYRTYIADERPTTAATVLKDLGFLE
jgi:hypothetical protein